jgi:hypothetical protein
MREVVQLMEFSGARDTTTRVYLRDFPPAKRQGLIVKCEEVFKLLDMQKPRVRDSPQKHITWARNVLSLLKIKLKSKRQGHGRTKRVTEYWLAPECEGFFELVEDFNPYPGGPTNPSKVPYSRQRTTVNVVESHAVTAISARESSCVDPLKVSVPWKPGRFVLVSLAPCVGSLPPVPFGWDPAPLASDDQAVVGDAELTELQAELAAEEESADEMAGLGCYADDQVAPSDDELAELQAELAESRDEMAELGCYADDPGAPSEADLAELQAELAESSDEMTLGCFADGSTMQDDSDFCVDD